MKIRKLVLIKDIVSSLLGGILSFFAFTAFVPQNKVMILAATLAAVSVFQSARKNDLFRGKLGDETVSVLKDLPIFFFIRQVAVCIIITAVLLVGIFLLYACVPALADHLSVFVR